MNSQDLSRVLANTKDLNFACKLRGFSPIRKSENELNGFKPDLGVKENKDFAGDLVTRPNTSAKSFSSHPDCLHFVSLEEVERLRKQVQEMEKKISENARILKEQLEQNEKLASCVKIMENREKGESGIFDRSSENNKKFSCDRVCIVW